MNNSPVSQGRISDHSHGVGTITNEMVTQRARELAIINARDGGKFTEADWQQARQDLSGRENKDERQTEEPVAGLTNWDETPDPKNHRVANSPSNEDDESVAEQLTREGMEEANHDFMLKGSRAAAEE